MKYRINWKGKGLFDIDKNEYYLYLKKAANSIYSYF